MIQSRRMIDLVRAGRSRREAAAIVAAELAEARRRLPPPPVRELHPLAEQWLAVCRGGGESPVPRPQSPVPCEQYRRAGTAEYCEMDACGDDGRRCVSAAVQTWTARMFGQAPPCPRQIHATARPGAASPPLPESGLISPARQRCIQIEITSACPGRCSNCSRFVALQRAPWVMDFQTFRRAVDSLVGYGGMAGIMGGEPTLHPQFAELVDYYRERWAPGPGLAQGREPIGDFATYHATQLARMDGQRCGLWSSLGPGYYRHFEPIQEVFGYQCLNDHGGQAVHQALLVTRRELGISDADWPGVRDRCWIQRLWSSSISPRGCYPCELMAALDALCDPLGPGERERLGIPAAGGWPIEPGWWRRQPSEFGRLLDWCELCGASLATPARVAAEQIQDVSPRWLEILTALGSPAIAAGRIRVLDPSSMAPRPSPPRHSDWYMPTGERRIAPGTAGLHPRRIEALCVSVDCGDELRRTLPTKVSQCDRVVVVTAPDDLLSQEVAREAGAELVVTDACFREGCALNKGALLNAGLQALELDDWVLFTDADIFLPPRWRERIAGLVLNPGCLYYTRRWHLPPEVRQPDWAQVTDYHLLDPHGNAAPWGYFQLVNVRARALRDGIRFPLCFCSAGSIDHWFQGRWPREKIIALPASESFEVLHVWHGPLAGRWNGYRDTRGRWCYAGQSEAGRAIHLARSWPVPCELRRTNILTCESETVLWTGGPSPPAWPTPADPRARYEIAYRELPDGSRLLRS